MAGFLEAAKYVTLVNLLAGKELLPEYFGWMCMSNQIAEHVIGWLENPASYHALRRELADLRARVYEPGACGRAAEAVLQLVSGLKRVAA